MQGTFPVDLRPFPTSIQREVVQNPWFLIVFDHCQSLHQVEIAIHAQHLIDAGWHHVFPNDPGPVDGMMA